MLTIFIESTNCYNSTTVNVGMNNSVVYCLRTVPLLHPEKLVFQKKIPRWKYKHIDDVFSEYTTVNYLGGGSMNLERCLLENNSKQYINLGQLTELPCVGMDIVLYAVSHGKCLQQRPV